MSLSKLPDRLLADVGSFLDFKEIMNLRQTNKRILSALKRNRMDKPKAKSVVFVQRHKPYDYENETSDEEIDVNLGLKSKSVIGPIQLTLVHTLPKTKSRRKYGSWTKIVDLLNKFESIEQVKFESCYIGNGIGKALLSLNTKINELNLHWTGFFPSEENFLHIRKAFKSLIFDDAHFDVNHINDETFLDIAKKCSFTTEYFDLRRRKEVPLTDKALEQMTEHNIRLKLRLDMLITSFSVDAIKKLIESALANGINNFQWNFGFLKTDQSEAFRNFENELIDKYRNIYIENEMIEDEFAKITVQHMNNADSFASFCLFLPAELANEQEQQELQPPPLEDMNGSDSGEIPDDDNIDQDNNCADLPNVAMNGKRRLATDSA